MPGRRDRRTFGEVLYPPKKARVPKGMVEFNRSAVTEEGALGGNGSGNLGHSPKEAVPGGKLLDCRYWEVLRRFHLAFGVREEHLQKEAEQEGKLPYGCWLLSSCDTFPGDFWMEWVEGGGHFAGERNSERAGGTSACECGLLMLVKYNVNLGVGIFWGNRPWYSKQLSS